MVLVVGSCVAVAGCGRSDHPLPRSVVQSFERAFNDDDADALAALLTEDAQVLPQQGEIVSGREDIREFMKAQMLPIISFNTETEMSLARGDIAIEQGHYTVRNVRRGSEVEVGKYMHVWKRQGDDWKLFRIMYNTDVAPVTQVTVSEADDAEGEGAG
jgi:uncharacterized protein (TIGR02246 family)